MPTLYLRDGIDIYTEELNSDFSNLFFVFNATRKRIHLKVKNEFTSVLQYFDGVHSIENIYNSFNIDKYKLNNFILYLEEKGILLPTDWYDNIPFKEQYKNIIKKQLYFLLDMTNSPEAVHKLQSEIASTKIAIFGMGSTGSWFFLDLLQMGFINFKLIDFKQMKEDSITRHAFFSSSSIESFKSEYYEKLAKRINPLAIVESHNTSITTNFKLHECLHDIDIIINCADEPYIGYTSIFLSRYVIKHNKLLFVAGGFDAHLGCLGELITPYKTPCADCYDKYFKESLKDWKPSPHPVQDRTKGFGGLPSLSVFSASAGALSLLRYFINKQDFLKTANRRGEFKFDDYNIDSFTVDRNPSCEICGDEY
ncbi:MAG: ThiF family adenylyltransferase [Eubacteriales bacterium]